MKLRLLLFALSATVLSSCDLLPSSALKRDLAELCKKDAGVAVYGTVPTAASRFNSYGQLMPTGMPFSEAAYGEDYIYRSRRADVVKSGAVRIVRDEVTVHKKVDGRLLGKSVVYTRIREISGFLPEADSCPSESSTPLVNQIFLKVE